MDIRALTVSSTGRARRLICDVVIESQNYTTTVPGLWDTGATSSCISHEVVQCLHPPFVRRVRVSTAGGEKDTDEYLVSVHLPNGVNFDDLPVMDSEIGTQNIGILIGMDIIGSGDFAVTNYNGQTVFTFRYPSIERIDFVQKANISNIIGPKHGKGIRKKK